VIEGAIFFGQEQVVDDGTGRIASYFQADNPVMIRPVEEGKGTASLGRKDNLGWREHPCE